MEICRKRDMTAWTPFENSRRRVEPLGAFAEVTRCRTGTTHALASRAEALLTGSVLRAGVHMGAKALTRAGSARYTGRPRPVMPLQSRLGRPNVRVQVWLPKATMQGGVRGVRGSSRSRGPWCFVSDFREDSAVVVLAGASLAACRLPVSGGGLRLGPPRVGSHMSAVPAQISSCLLPDMGLRQFSTLHALGVFSDGWCKDTAKALKKAGFDQPCAKGVPGLKEFRAGSTSTRAVTTWLLSGHVCEALQSRANTCE